jgi:glycosyltransferase involved in cell wall biosynthesis
MRILYLANEELPGRTGGSVHAWEVARGLAARGHAVTVLVNRAEGQPPEERIEGVRIVRAKLRVRGRMIPLRGLPAAMRLSREVDVILERHITPGGAGAAIARARRIPLVLEVNSPHVEEFIWRMNVRSRILKRALRAWVAWQFHACRLAVAPRENIVPDCARDRVAVRGWGVDTERFRPEAAGTPAAEAFAKRHALAGRVPVLFAGSFRAWHGARDLPEIARRTLARAPEAKFVLVGEGELFEEVRAAVETQGLSKDVAVAGSVPHEEMPAVVAACAIGIAPYDTAAYAPLARFGFFWSPLKIFEYMACALPVVLFAYEGLREHVGEAERGLAVTPRDLDAFAGAIALLARDPRARREMGERGRDYVVREHTWRDHVAWLDARLIEVVGARAGAAPAGSAP